MLKEQRDRVVVMAAVNEWKEFFVRRLERLCENELLLMVKRN
jgi:hypothetical protein